MPVVNELSGRVSPNVKLFLPEVGDIQSHIDATKPIDVEKSVYRSSSHEVPSYVYTAGRVCTENKNERS
jgi:hypothetical protein